MGGYYGSPKVILKNNRDLLGKKNKLTRKDYIGFKDVYTEDHIKATPELLEQIRNKITAENKKKKETTNHICISFYTIYCINNLWN